MRTGQVYNLYHGTLEAKPVSATASKLVYTLILDNSMLADDAARKADVERRRARFTQALKGHEDPGRRRQARAARPLS